MVDHLLNVLASPGAWCLPVSLLEGSAPQLSFALTVMSSVLLDGILPGTLHHSLGSLTGGILEEKSQINNPSARSSLKL